MKPRHVAAALALAGAAAPACAGPPYLTDDPVPTDLHHWEIYAFGTGEGRHSVFDADVGFDLNYGGAKDLQLTATLPLTFSHEPHRGWQSGAGDVELAVKYRFLNDEQSGISAAVFPRVFLPTASHSPDERIRLLLPVWLQKDFAGGTSLFGGGGYEINPGSGNRNFWQGGIAVTHDFSDTVSLGAEVEHEGPDATDATASTSAGAGAIVKLGGPYALLVSGGPTWADHRTGYHLYGALGFFF